MASKAIAMLVALAFALVPAARSATVHSLGKVPGQLTTHQAKSYWAREMAGKKGPDGLGMRLPPGLTAARLIALILPAGDKAKPSLVGARAWPGGGKGRYVAIICTGGAAFDPDDPVCAEGADNAPPLQVYLAIVAMRPGAVPRLVARAGPLAGKVDWGLTDMPAPDDVEGAKPVAPQRFQRFDLGRYRIAPGQIAFGLRVGWTYGYSGGGAEYTALLLFAVEGAALRQVLAAPISAFRNIAGDWHPDGTRDHDISDEGSILIVSSNCTAGHFDLIVKARNWNPVTRAWASITGVGVEYRMAKGLVEIRSPVVGAPAARAGLRPGDVIVGIDGKPVLGMKPAAIEAAMNGRLGAKVGLTIRRAGRPQFTVTVARALVTLAPSPLLDYKWLQRAGAYRAAACTKPCL